jgi:hypothetical protein
MKFIRQHQTETIADNTGDPWRDVTVSADGQNIQSSPSQPILVGDGFHCSDLGTAAGQVDRTIAHVQKVALSYMKTWLADWRPSSNSTVVRRSIGLVQGGRGAAKRTSSIADWGVTPEILQVLDAKPLSAWSRGAGTF